MGCTCTHTPKPAEALPHEVFTASMFDRRKYARPTLPVWKRPWSKVTGICLHQTACHMGERLERYDAINVHFVVTRAGKILRLYDLDTATCHGNGWNNQTVGIEIDGLYAGQEDDPTTLVDESLLTTWNDPTTPHRETPMQVTPEAMEAARNLVRWICEEVALNKGKVGVLVAHRQSSASRRNDPGEAIWRAVALPMMAELGLHSGGDGFKLDDGYPIPEVWGGANGIKY